MHLFPSVNLVNLCLPEGSRIYVDDGEQVKAGTLICSYQELDYRISDKKWISEFYERFIKNLDENEILSIYEVKRILNSHFRRK